ncbi:MAG: hypothetical protein QN163_03895 [Armatimonadota bacterium]|nr:hypothetical protein [Armatimonadota bacterium]MDR5696835.1 hypothetical protein [Armatimonadota bacterium]
MRVEGECPRPPTVDGGVPTRGAREVTNLKDDNSRFFSCPSREGLSVSHSKNHVPTDVLARYERMQGHGALYPMDWNAFGLPAKT